MPVFSISSVDASANTITTSAPHGQVTGNGPAALFVDSGGVAPGGLAPVTDYWLIVVDSTTLKLATSSANAMSNTPIDITSTGTLPLSLQLGIPYRRARTNAPLTQIRSADLNAIQDSLTGIYDALTAQAQSLFTGVQLAGLLEARGGVSVPTAQNITLAGTADVKHGDRVLTLSAAMLIGAGNGSAMNLQSAPIRQVFGAAGTVMWALPLKEGDRIKSITTSLKGDGAVDLTAYQVIKTSAAGADTALASDVGVNNVSSSWHDQTLDISPDYTLGAGEAITVLIQPNATGLEVGNLRITFDRP